MASGPPERIIDSLTLYTAEGAPVVVQRWTNPTRVEGGWREDGPPTLRTEDGHPVAELRGGQYQDETTEAILYAEKPSATG